MLKLMGKKIITILRKKILHIILLLFQYFGQRNRNNIELRVKLSYVFNINCSLRNINDYYTSREFPIQNFHRRFCLFVFVALRPMSTAMVIAGRSVHLTTLFPGQA